MESYLPIVKRDIDILFQTLSALRSKHSSLNTLSVHISLSEGGGIPETGFGGSSFKANEITLILDPTRPTFSNNLLSGMTRRTLAHEIHHALRYEGPGYGTSLGEAIVSEGLADHFDLEISHGIILPWCRALDPTQIKTLKPTLAANLHNPHYIHSDWFFGTSPLIPKWAGYTLGFQMVGAYLNLTQTTPSQHFHTPASTIFAELSSISAL